MITTLIIFAAVVLAAFGWSVAKAASRADERMVQYADELKRAAQQQKDGE